MTVEDSKRNGAAMKTETTGPNFRLLTAWGASEWESYARGFLAARGIFDPAGGLWLGAVLAGMAPDLKQADPVHRRLESIQAMVAHRFAERDADQDSDDEGHVSGGHAVEWTDVTSDGSPGPRWLKLLSLCTWVYGAPHHGRRLQYPAIPEVIVEPLAALLGGRGSVGADGKIRVNGEVVGAFASDRTLAEALGTVAAHRILRFVVGRAWVNAVERLDLPDEVVVERGWLGLAQYLGLESRSGAQDIQRAGEALGALTLATPLGREKLLDVRKTKRGNVTTLTLVAKGPLAVGYTGRLRKAKKPDRLLVPLRPDVPVLTRQRSSHAQQLSFEMTLLREFRLRLRDRSVEVPLRFGGWNPRLFSVLSDSTIDAAAGTAGLSRKNLDAVLALWRGPGDAGGWIARVRPNAETHVLHGTSELMESFMLRGLRLTLRGQAMAARSTRARAAARRGARPE